MPLARFETGGSSVNAGQQRSDGKGRSRSVVACYSPRVGFGRFTRDLRAQPRCATPSPALGATVRGGAAAAQ